MKRAPFRGFARALTVAALASAVLVPVTTFVTATPAAAIETNLTGRVVDGNGNGIVTRMHLFQAQNHHVPVLTFFSEADGTFTIPDVDADYYQLRAESQDLQGPPPVWYGNTRDPQQATIIPVDGYTFDLGDIVYGPYATTPPVADLRVTLGHSDGTDAPATTAELYRVGESTPRATIVNSHLDQARFFNVPTGTWDVRAVPHPQSGDLPSWYQSGGSPSSVTRPASAQVTMGGQLTSISIYTQADPYFGLYAGGTVRNDGGQPIAGALVTLHHDGGSSYPRYTDANGEFTFPAQAPDGDYRIEVSHPDYVSEWWEDAATPANASIVRIEDGHTEELLDIRLAGYTLIQGIVTGPSDEYLENAPVFLLSDPQPALGNIVETVFTDAFGQYRFSDVPAGTYYLYFKAPAQSGLLGEWWNDTRTAGDAEAITILGGGERLRFDAQLASNPQPEIPGESCYDPFGNVIPCEDPGCEEGDEQCPVDPCVEGDEQCPPEPCYDAFGNEVPCADPCEEGDENCPTDPECPTGTESHDGECVTTSTTPDGDSKLASTGAEPPLLMTMLAAAALAAGAALLLARRRAEISR